MFVMRPASTTAGSVAVGRVSGAIGVTVSLIAACAALAWASGSGTLQFMRAGWLGMSWPVAWCFVLSGMALRLLAPDRRGVATTVLGRLLAVPVIVTGVMMTDLNLIGDFGFRETVVGAIGNGIAHADMLYPGVAFVLIGGSLLLLDARVCGKYCLAEYPALLAGVIGMFAVTGHIYQASAGDGMHEIFLMGLSAALLFPVLAIGLLSARPECGLAAAIASRSSGGYMARHLLPTALILMTFTGWLRWRGQLAGFYDTVFGLALFTTAFNVTIIAIIWYVAIALNREDRRRRKAELRFELLFEVAPHAMILVDHQGRIRQCNAQTHKLFGYPAEELIGQAVEKLVPDKYRPAHAGNRQHYMENPQARPMGEGRYLIARRNDGSEVPVEIGLGAVEGEEGPLVMALIIDLSAYKRVEDALRESERFLTTLVGNLPGMVYRCRPDDARTMIYVSEGCRELTGYMPTDLLEGRRQSYAALICPGECDKVLAEIRCAVELRRTYVIEYCINTFDGRIKWLREKGRAIEDRDGAGLVLEGFIMDISEQRTAEEALRDVNLQLEQRVRDRTAQLETSNNELTSFSYSVSHDLRAPLRVISGFSNILLEEHVEALNPEGRHYLERVCAEAQRMGDLIDGLLTLAHLSHHDLHISHVDLTALAQDITAELRRDNRDRDVNVVIEPGMTTMGDGGLLRILLHNLFNNAWKFTRNRDHAEICFGQTRQEDETVYYVRDNGAGFDMDYVKKIFGAFQRLHSSAEFEGSGIGLATAQRIVHRHGGRIWAEGVVDLGAAFYFTLKL
jgi:PAS domain S-box-containing protein